MSELTNLTVRPKGGININSFTNINKSTVHEHTRTTKTGKISRVKQYEDSRKKKEETEKEKKYKEEIDKMVNQLVSLKVDSFNREAKKIGLFIESTSKPVYYDMLYSHYVNKISSKEDSYFIAYFNRPITDEDYKTKELNQAAKNLSSSKFDKNVCAVFFDRKRMRVLLTPNDINKYKKENKLKEPTK